MEILKHFVTAKEQIKRVVVERLQVGRTLLFIKGVEGGMIR